MSNDINTEHVAFARDTYVRYDERERANHWLIVVCAVLLMLSGLAFFHPAFYWLTALFGGGQAARAIHPWIGVVLALAFVYMGTRFFKQNIWTPEDKAWMSRIKEVVNNSHAPDLPEAGRFNAAQKIVFYVMFWSVVTLFLSGLVLWQHYFGDSFPIWLQRLAGLLHGTMAAAMIVTMIVHIYAAIWNVGSVRAMTRGPVTGGWLYKHHRKFLREEVIGRK
ncbi:MAG: formate dehydrogenase subunit gamma [Rhodospirillales bacterium]|nr:formate dehydrogenase subunit gamma [Rhodospirillales bacterium]